MKMMKFAAAFLLLLFGSSFLQGQENTLGTILINNDKVAEGYTLFAPVTSTTTYLVDNCGNTINTWSSFRNPGLSVYLLENGNLVRTRREDNNVFFAGGVGGGIEIFDWDGNLIWEYVLSNEQNVLHHDIAPMSNGNILAIAYDFVTQEQAMALGRKAEYTPERGLWVAKIIEIKPLANNDFDIVWEWTSVDHVIQDEDSQMPNFGQLDQNPEKLNINYFRSFAVPESDWMHCNAIDYNEELDQILLNSKNFNEFYIIDHSTTTEEARGSTGGLYGKGGDFLYRWGNPETYGMGTVLDRKLFEQHDAHWIDAGKKDAGKVIVFNNGLGRPEGAISTVDIIDVPVQEDGSYIKEDGLPFGPVGLDFSYGNNPGDENILSTRMSGVAQLPNDNILVASANSGTLREIDATQTVVWKYVVPTAVNDVGTQGDSPFANAVFRAYKYPLDYPAFENNEIVVGDPIELNPNNGFCEGTVSTSPVSLAPVPFEVVNTLVYDQMTVRSKENIEIDIIDITGRVYKTIQISIGEQPLDLSNLTSGMYYIKNGNSKYPNFAAVPFLKMN